MVNLGSFIGRIMRLTPRANGKTLGLAFLLWFWGGFGKFISLSSNDGVFICCLVSSSAG